MEQAGTTNGYTVDTRNKVKRVPDRGHYDKETVYAILDAGYLCHISFVMDDQPFIIPTLYGREDDKLYIHGANTSRLIKHLDKGVAMSLAVTHVDGIVLARSAFHHSMNYRSVVVFGHARKVPDAGKENALYIISESVLKGRWNESRLPNAKELKATTVLETEIEQASAKIRTGGPRDEKEDYALDIWAGVLPLEVRKLPPVSDELLKEGVELAPSVRDAGS